MATQTNNNKGSKGDQLHLFVTGATGYIGSVVVQHAVAEGHTVRGLSRNEAGDARLRELGATPVRGELTSMDVLREESTKADAVLHLAYIHDFGMDYDEVLRQDAAAVDALGAGLRGTGKALVLTSGTAVVAPDPTGRETTEDSPLSQTFILKDRIRSEEHALGLSEDDVRVTVLRLPPYVYGRGGSFFVPMLLEAATKAKASIYVDDGSLRTSDVHVDDAAALYLLAAKAKPNRQVYNGTGSTSVTLRQLAEAIGEVLQLPVRSVTRQEAETLWGPFLTGFVQFENRASNRKAVSQLGWQPKGVDMLTDIRSGSYRDLAKKLQTELSAYCELCTAILEGVKGINDDTILPIDYGVVSKCWLSASPFLYLPGTAVEETAGAYVEEINRLDVEFFGSGRLTWNSWRITFQPYARSQPHLAGNLNITGFGRIVDPVVNFDQLKAWLNRCQCLHGETCHTPKRAGHAQQSKRMKCVDFEQRCIVDTDPGCRYLALSYVWEITTPEDAPSPMPRNSGARMVTTMAERDWVRTRREWKLITLE